MSGRRDPDRPGGASPYCTAARSSMPYRVKVLENEEISLSRVLGVIRSQDLNWSLLFLWATGDLGADESIEELEDRIRESADGVQLDWHELEILAAKFAQVIDMVLIGCGKRSCVRRYNTDEEMYAKCDIVVEVIDSGFWLVHSQEEKVVLSVRNRFLKWVVDS